MLTAYFISNGALNRNNVYQFSELPAEPIWLDLINPTEQERLWIRQAYNQELQFMEDLGEIEASARFYRDGQGLHLNQYFLMIDNNVARNVNVAFILNSGRLFTLRSEELPLFRAFYSQTGINRELCRAPVTVMLGIIATHIGMMADQYERLQTELEPVSQAIFRSDARTMPRVLESLTRIEDVNGKARLGLLENKRAYPSLSRTPEAAEHAESIHEISHDVESLMIHAGFLAERTKFLMDAAMGTINIAFNKRLNIFTVLSVILMPPTLIASIYGMNFRNMPELEWLYGYPLVLALMLVVAIGPILYLKSKDWL